MPFLTLNSHDQHLCAGTIASTHDAHSLSHLTAQKDLLYVAFCIVFGCEEEEVGTLSGKQEAGGSRGIWSRIRSELKRIEEHLYHF